jgi:hypothetical protein
MLGVNYGKSEIQVISYETMCKGKAQAHKWGATIGWG